MSVERQGSSFYSTCASDKAKDRNVHFRRIPIFPFLVAPGEQPSDGLHKRLQDILAAGLQVGLLAALARGGGRAGPRMDWALLSCGLGAVLSPWFSRALR